MAVIIPFNPKRFDSVPFSEQPFASDHGGVATKFRIREDAEGSGYKLVEMLLPPAAAYDVVQEMMERYMVAPQEKAKPKRKAHRRA